ncbi:hypothetical protein CORC01_03625 [Colletotrichum orchidophilum]|uniref:Uncharacterized protein n=1 Tax=Colletotrichum orchidophilum TaxID=1209926 RepID=A0A1G4BID2_9PEZI|nr:uncharacterized protein CORC01_03625 [Colletotrichum orchidophilum]OHF01058.1 hypothetical protein CORC01_03625 [Colletotrichum orchidophilum]
MQQQPFERANQHPMAMPRHEGLVKADIGLGRALDVVVVAHGSDTDEVSLQPLSPSIIRGFLSSAACQPLLGVISIT